MNLAIFDLDGTLIDSRLDIVNSANAARVHLGFEPLPESVVLTYVGNGAPTLIRRTLEQHATDELAERGLAFFLDHYRRHLLDNTAPYPGVEAGLHRLRDANVPMAILTNKPTDNAITIINALGWSSLFHRVYGGDSFPRKKPDPIGIDELRRELSVEPRRTIMVGDSRVDIQTARNAGVVSCGVTYGLQPETLPAENPDHLFDTFKEVADLILA